MDFTGLRFPNIFRPEGPAPVTAPQLEELPVQPLADMMKVGPDFTPETQMQERLEQLLNQFPQKKKAGILHKIAASLAGFSGGPQAAIKTLEAPYQREVDNWKEQFQPVYQAANLERYGNVNERQLYRDERRYQTEQDKLNLATRKQDEVERANKVKEEINQKRAAAYDFYSRNRNWKSVTAEDGTVWFVNPIPPHQKVSTGLKSGELSDYDKIMWGVTGRMMAQDEAHKDRMAEIEARGENTIDAIERRAELKSEDKTLLPNQKKQAIINNARELIARDPKAAEWITITDDSVEIERPGKSWWRGTPTGPTQEEYDAIVNKLYGENAPTTDKKEEAPKPPANKPQANKVPPKGKVLMLKPNGQKVYVPMEKLNEAKSKGYKTIAGVKK